MKKEYEPRRHGEIESGIVLITEDRKSNGLVPGMAIVMTSSELPELLSLCDRIMVMRSGKISAVFSRDEATQTSRRYRAMCRTSSRE